MRIFNGDTVIATLEAVHKNKSKADSYSTFSDRMFHGFVYKVEGSSQYFFNNKVVDLGKNELIYLPKHSQYAFRVEDSGSYMVINFTIHSPVLLLSQRKSHLKITPKF